MQIFIVAGGDLEMDLLYKQKEGIWVGVDRGTLAIIEAGYTPTIAFGDFDSVTEEEKRRIVECAKKVEFYSPEKDETDTEIALQWALKQRPEKIRLFAGTGGRQDHFIANIQLLIQIVKQGYPCTVEMVDKKNIITVKGPGTYTVKKDRTKKYISFFALTEKIKNLSLTGFKYPLENKTLALGDALCISNELITDVGTFSFTDGILMMVRSSD